jgi:hypothetical protein
MILHKVTSTAKAITFHLHARARVDLETKVGWYIRLINRTRDFGTWEGSQFASTNYMFSIDLEKFST